MYRDDRCAVCGESLPPDHFYCAEHGATVDERLHALGARLRAVAGEAAEVAALLEGIADETWDYLAEGEPDDPSWPTTVDVHVRADPDQVEVDVDSEPGFVRVRLRLPAAALLDAAAAALQDPQVTRLAQACAGAQGANATH